MAGGYNELDEEKKERYPAPSKGKKKRSVDANAGAAALRQKGAY